MTGEGKPWKPPMAQGVNRSRGGSPVHVKPEGKMGRFSTPLTWFPDYEPTSAVKQLIKKAARKKRRQRDKEA